MRLYTPHLTQRKRQCDGVSRYGTVCAKLAGVVTRKASDLSRRVAIELKNAQRRKEFTWTAIEEATGITHATMMRMINGQTDIPINRLMLICEAAGISVTEVIEDATRHAPYKLHDLLTDHSVSPTVSDGPASVTSIQQQDWNRYTGKKAADIDDEVQKDAEA